MGDRFACFRTSKTITALSGVPKKTILGFVVILDNFSPAGMICDIIWRNFMYIRGIIQKKFAGEMIDFMLKYLSQETGGAHFKYIAIFIHRSDFHFFGSFYLAV